MATWEDGPEYAPAERPSDFASAAAAPLPMAPPVPQMAAYAPKARPLFEQPSAPVAPLTTLVPPVAEQRDPQAAFEVASSTMTAEATAGAWGAVHWGAPTGPPVSPFPPGPQQPLALRSSSPASAGAFPAPGTPEWFGPGPYANPPAAPVPVGAKQVLNAATPGLCICLLIGALLYVIAPIMLGVCLGLTSRVTVAKDAVRKAFWVGVTVLAFVAVIAALVNLGGFAEWWGVVGRWALAICWVMLIATVALVYRGLRAGPPPAPRAPWG